jgi:hypothetical protein
LMTEAKKASVCWAVIFLASLCISRSLVGRRRVNTIMLDGVNTKVLDAPKFIHTALAVMKKLALRNYYTPKRSIIVRTRRMRIRCARLTSIVLGGLYCSSLMTVGVIAFSRFRMALGSSPAESLNSTTT